MEIIESPSLTKSEEKTFKVILGDEVFSVLNEPAFLEQWDMLYRACRWATVFQSKEFVTTWYNLFKADYTPIMVKMEEAGNLRGLLLLALTPEGEGKTRSYIVGAGHGEADYHAWLTNEEDSSYFIRQTLNTLLDRFPDKYISLRHLPPDVPKGFVDEDPSLKKRCVFQPFTRPVVNLNKYKISKRDRKRVNRLKRLGTFEKITDYEVLESMIDDLGTLYDFRQAAMFNKFPFRGEPLNREFILQLFKQDVLEVTVLLVEGEIVAAVASVHGKDRAILGGINLHSPAYSSYSPGYVHFLLLFEMLSERDVRFFDLTPGNDTYKMRLASQVETVHELTVTNSPLFKLNRVFRIHVYNYLIKKGHNPLMLKLSYSREKYLLKQRGVKNYLLNLLKKKRGGAKKEIMNVDLGKIQQGKLGSMALKLDDRNDLLNYKYQKSGLTRWEFLEESMRKMEQGDHVYSYAENEVLLGAAWVQKTKVDSENPEAASDGKTASVILYDLYLHPEFRERGLEFSQAILKTLKEQGEDLVEVQLEEEHNYLKKHLV